MNLSNTQLFNIKAALALISVCLSTPTHADAYDPALIPTLEADANAAWVVGKPTYDTIASSGVGVDGYTLMYVLKASLDLYEATENPLYFERALIHSELLIASAPIIDDLGYTNWSNANTYDDWTTQGQGSVSYFLYDLQASTEPLRLAYIAHSRPSQLAAYKDRAVAVGAWTNKNFFDKWEARALDKDAPFLDNLVNTVEGGVVKDKSPILGRILLYAGVLYPSTRKTVLLNALQNSVQQHLAVVSGTDIDVIDADDLNIEDPANGLGHDVSHYNRYTLYYSDMLEIGHGTNRVALDGTIRAFNELIYDNTEHPRWTNFVDGTNPLYRNMGPFVNGIMYFGNDRIGQWNQQAQENLLEFYNYIRTGAQSDSRWNASVYGNYALPSGIARNIKFH